MIKDSFDCFHHIDEVNKVKEFVKFVILFLGPVTDTVGLIVYNWKFLDVCSLMFWKEFETFLLPVIFQAFGFVLVS